MPANIAHMLICNKVVKVLQGEGGEYQQFIGTREPDSHLSFT